VMVKIRWIGWMRQARRLGCMCVSLAWMAAERGFAVDLSNTLQ
jgi:hypothetical protein